MNSKRQLQLLEREISYLEKTLVNDYISLKTKMLQIKSKESVSGEYKDVEVFIKQMIPQSAHYIDNLQYWDITFDDIDDPLDFSDC